MKTFLTAVIINFLVFSQEIAQAQAPLELSSSLWRGIGGKTKWDSTNYILFSVTGNDSEFLQNGRKFLINKRSGQVRFEGKTENGNNIVALFNFKTEKLSKLFSNGEERPVSTEVNTVFTRINEQFKKDAAFIFLPALIDAPDTRTGKVSSKIVNAEKLLSVSFQLKDNSLSGELLFNGETGYIKQIIDKEGNEYFVNGYKDIGGGLVLPTVFKSMNGSEKSATFPTAAAFTDMEESKFSNL